MNCLACDGELSKAETYCGVCGVPRALSEKPGKGAFWLTTVVVFVVGFIRLLFGTARAFDKGLHGQYSSESNQQWRDRLQGELLEKQVLFEEKPSQLTANNLREAKKKYASSLKTKS